MQLYCFCYFHFRCCLWYCFCSQVVVVVMTTAVDVGALIVKIHFKLHSRYSQTQTHTLLQTSRTVRFSVCVFQSFSSLLNESVWVFLYLCLQQNTKNPIEIKRIKLRLSACECICFRPSIRSSAYPQNACSPPSFWYVRDQPKSLLL